MTDAASYKDFSRRRVLLLLLFSALLALTALFDMTVGAARLPVAEILKGVFHPGSVSDMTRAILWTLRFPASLTAAAVGAALGLSGAVMQTILRNPLASPYTLGVGAGAAFGASLAILCSFHVPFLPADAFVPLFSFVSAMSVCLLIYALGRVRGMSSDTMVLAGIALLFLFRALQALLQYFADEGDLQAMVFWTFGSLQKAAWPKLAFTAAVFALCFPAVMRDAWKYTALLLGDEKAESLGVKTSRLKLRGFFLVSLLSAAAVCFVGTIGFIGLAGPHIARLLAGDDQRFYLPLSSLCGALLLSAASVISKALHPGSIFPIGIITSLIGVPFFFALILRRWRTLS
ncbi:MAG: FecCD family ABC transporter permease [Pyramidobacter sp.]|jgi:iron complex transport system permease protein